MNQVKLLKFHYSNVDLDGVWNYDRDIKSVPNDVHLPEGLVSSRRAKVFSLEFLSFDPFANKVLY